MSKRAMKFRAWLDGKMILPAQIQDKEWELSALWLSAAQIHFMQFTGLYDTEGRPIYEGDIVEVLGVPSEILYSCSNASFRYQYISPPYHIEALGNYSAPAFLVVGNIYEDPELKELVK